MQRTLGQINFDAYNDSGPHPGLTWDGKPIPKWTATAPGEPEISDVTRERWEAGARAVKHTAERALLDQLTATIGDKKDIGAAFERAVKRYDIECIAHNGPLALKVLFEIFANELKA